jgi:NAD(P)-dependent dehydrogenase (short-subunit alcohol dehydrogenase family)
VSEPAPLAGKVALVTGGASGIGAAVAAELAARGAKVAITDIDDAKLDAAKSRGLIALRVDNRNVDEIKTAVLMLETQAGHIDILVNNAGISGFSLGLEQIDEAGFTAMIDTHVKGAFFFAQAIVPGMKSRGSGRIINMSSNFSMTGSPNMSHYVAAKSALLGLTKAWAREFASYGITVNALAPGLIATPLTQRSVGPAELALRAKDIPLGRLAKPEEIAYAVAWLAGPEAAMMTGQVMSPNGGASIVGI